MVYTILQNGDIKLTSFPEPKVTSSYGLFWPTNNPNLKDIQFTIMYDNENQKIVLEK